MDLSTRGTEARFLAGILESSSDAIVLVDRAGMLTEWSDAAEKMFGEARSDPSIGSFEDLFPPEWREETAAIFARASVGQPARTTTVALRSDGSRLIVEVTCSAVGGPVKGEQSDYVVVLRDVTEPMLIRAAAESVAFEADASAALESFAAVLAHVVPIEILTLTAVEAAGTARRVAGAGRRAAELQGGEILSMSGTPLAAAVKRRHPVVCHDTAAGDLPYDAVLAAAGVGSYVVLPLFHGGRIIATLNVGFAATGAPTPSVVSLLSSLITSVMPIVLNLLTLEEQAHAIRQLERFDALKNEFLALITHDMRTPLSVINGFAEQLQQRWSELDEAEKLESVDTILRNGRSLYRLVEEGLEIGRIESGAFAYELRSVALGDEVERTVADLSASDANRIRLSSEGGLPLVRCDPDRHRQILVNLLSNALKYSPPDTAVDVELTYGDSMVRVAVRDRGPGIEPTDLPRVFQRFSRVGTQHLAAPGSGLGLYISKALVEAQGGQMWAQSEPGCGSTFVYTLPAAEAGGG
jgi:two-component system, NtrC family, sensor histidine kinase KinB